MQVTVKIPRSNRALVLDDNEDRLQWFKGNIPNVTCVSTVDDAINHIAAQRPAYDVIFLDHDLGELKNGQDVARHLAETGFLAHRVIIHSWNPRGAKAMMDILENATAIPFGQFTIELVDA